MKSMLLFYVQITASQFLGKPCDAPAIVFRVVSKSYAINLIVLLVTPHHSFKVIVEWRRRISQKWCILETLTESNIQCESKKIPPRGPDSFSFFFTNGWEFVIDFCTHLLNVPIFARSQIFFQLSPILTKLCHIKRDYPVHIICAKCPKRDKTHAFRRLRKSLIALMIVVCGKSL